jgi:hypothetical protein
MIGFISLILLALHFSSAYADFVMEVIAGTGVAATTGNGGPGPLASVDTPSGIWSDSVGNAYFVTYSDSHVRVVDAATGIISSLMGDGTFHNFNIDSGPGPSISLVACQGITGDTLGEFLYVIDAIHVWKYEIATGIATRYAGAATHFGDQGITSDGGQARDALFQTLAGGWFTNDGTLFIVDEFASQIHKITSDGIISHVSGKDTRGYAGDDGPADSTDVMFKFPNNIYVDSIGEMYISDAGNQVIRKIDNTGILTTFAGGGFFYPIPGTDIGARDLLVWAPYAISGDTNGNIFYADYGNDAIFKIDSNQRVTTYIGRAGWGGVNVAGISPSSASIYQPYGVYWNNFKNRIYITEQSGELIKRSIPGGSLYPTSGPSSSPTGSLISPSSLPSSGPVSVPTIVPTSAPSVPSSIPSSQPISSPSGEPTSAPAAPTSIPSSKPISSPSGEPTSAPAAPTSIPSSKPISSPSGEPTSAPAIPTSVPSRKPSSLPSESPTNAPIVPTSLPSSLPIAKPSAAPSGIPSSTPSSIPLSEPSSVPTAFPTAVPSWNPSSSPSTIPSTSPQAVPTCIPKVSPSSQPSSFPSKVPTGRPSSSPISIASSPSFIPTIAPNANEQVKIEGSLVIGNVHSNTLNNVSLMVIKAAIVNISSNAQTTTIKSIELLKKKGSFQMATYNFTVDFQCIYHMSFYPLYNSSYLTAMKKNNIENAVTSGFFQILLHQHAIFHNATQLSNATCDTVTLSSSLSTVESSVSTDNKDNAITVGAVVGIAIGGFVVGFCCFFVMLTYSKRRRESRVYIKDDSNA